MGEQIEVHSTVLDDAETPVQQAQPAKLAQQAQFVGPHLTCLGTISGWHKGHGNGRIVTADPAQGEIYFTRHTILGPPGVQPAQGMICAFSYVDSRANQVYLLHRLTPCNMMFGKVKSFSSSGGFGFVNPILDTEHPDTSGDTSADYHFRADMCAPEAVHAVGPGRLCVIVPEEQRARCQNICPLLYPTEHQGAGWGAQACGQSISINFSQLGLPEHVLAREDVQQMVQYNAVETVHQLMASWQGGPVQQQQAPMLMGWQPAGRGAAQQRPRSADEWEGGGPGAKRPAIGAERAPLSPAEQVPLSADQLAQAKTGTVKSWSNANKYGFIIPDEGGRDVLADVASLSPLFNGELEAGSAVCYTLKMGSTAGKQRAASVQPSDGTERALVRHGGAGRGQPAGPVRNAAHAARQQAAAAAPYGAPVALRNAQQPPPPPPAPQLRTHAAPLHGDSATTSGFGTVKSYNPQKGFGFIQDDATGQDIHVGQDVLAKAGLQGMEKGMRLGFLLVPSRSRASQVWPSD